MHVTNKTAVCQAFRSVYIPISYSTRGNPWNIWDEVEKYFCL